MASRRSLLLVAALVVSTVAVPVAQKGQCARYCTDENDISLSPGSTYTYDYETSTVTSVRSTSQDKTQMQITAQADIQVLSKCELSLRLRGVSLKLSDPRNPDYLVSPRSARDFASSLEKYVLKFSFQNGQVEHVCPSENAPAWITNIQKGVLSAFQTYNVKPEWTTRTVETDILGKCTAEYHSLGKSWQGTHTIRKLKNLGSCTNRENIETHMQGTPYTQEFDTKSLPVVKGSQECEQVMGSGFLQTSTCNEKLVFRPFSSSRSNSVVTTVSQKLVFADVKQRVFTGNDYRSTPQLLLYSHAPQESNNVLTEDEAESALKVLCESSKDDISILVPRHFSSFIYKLKKLSFQSLKAFYQKTDQICPQNTKAKKFFMDAIPLVGTIESARFMYEMISRKIVSDTESKFWLTSLSFVTGTTPQIISTFTPLLEGRFEQAILGVSALIHNYCKDNDCSKVPEVQAAVYKLAENLGDNCFNTEDKNIILSLKAMGNIGHLFGREDLLQSCYKNPQIRTEARLAAIDAFRRVSCDINREELMKTYSNYNEETEIRIASYLAIMRCPTHDTVLAVKDVLMKETINHVGSFIWTHLTALAKTKHPERQDIRDIVSNLYLLNKYESDARKFSSAKEATFYLESIDSGMHVDTNIVFSTDSYLPKTAMFNLTLDVFGKTCNLFQIDGRLEGLEHVVESFFGPRGYFPQKNVAKLLRERRSVDESKLNAIDSQFREHYPSQQQPYGSVDVKVFGTSMWYNQFRTNDDGTPDINLLDIVTKLAEENDREYSRSFTFLDTTFTVPMTSGLPLKIALNGTASVALKIGGKFDVKDFEHVDVVGHIEPSGAIEIAGLLSVDAGSFARSGMRIVSTMHSSSVLDGKVKVKNGQVISAQLNMPRDRIDIFNIQSKLYLVHGSEEHEKKRDKRGGTDLKSCTGESVSTVLGIQVCSELQLPPYRAHSPLHPLNGPAAFSLYLEKTDPTLKSYNFDAQWKSEMKKGGFIKRGVFSLNTPNSKTDRDINIELNLNQPEHTASIKIKTPIKRLGVNANLVNNNAQKKLDLSVSVDDSDYLSIQSNLAIADDKYSLTYTPSLEIRLDNKRLTAVSGSTEIRYGHKYAAQIQVEDLTEKPITAKGNIEIGKRDRYEVEMSLSSFPLDGTLKGYAQLGDNLSTRFTADYRILEGKMNKLNILGKMKNLSANTLTKYTGMLNIQASVLPEWNTELSFETMKTNGHIENSISASLGDGIRSRKHTIKFQEILRYEGNLANNKVDAALKLSYPEKNIDYAVNLKHENTERSLKNEFQLQYGAGKKISTEVDLSLGSGKYYSGSGDLNLKYPGRETFLKVELNQSGEKEYRGTMSCQWQTGKKMSTVVHYRDRSDNSRLKYEIDGNLQIPQTNPISFSTTAGYHRGQLAAVSELSIGENKYRTKADYAAGHGLNHRMSGQITLRNDIYGMEASINNVKDKMSGIVEVKMPNRRRISAKIEGRMFDSAKYGSFETYWDADRDATKRFSISGELRTKNDGYDGKISMQLRRRTVKGVINTSNYGKIFSSQWKTNNKVEIEWSPTEKITSTISINVHFDRNRKQLGSHVELTTPYYGFENVSFSLSHLYTFQQWESELSSSLPGGNELTVSTFGKYTFTKRESTFETTGKLQSSFSGFEEIALMLAHDQNTGEFNNKAEVKWGRVQRIAYQMNGLRQSNLVKGSIKLRTPFSYMNDAIGEIEHSFNGYNYKTKGAFQLSPSQRIGFNSELNHELTGRRRICTVRIEGNTPFSGYENTDFKMTYSNDGMVVTTESEVTLNRLKIKSSLDLSKRNQNSNSLMEGKFLFTSPFKNYDYVQITSSLELSKKSYKMNVDTSMLYGLTATLNSQGKMKSLNDLEFNMVLMGQYPGYREAQRLALDLVHKLQDSKLRSSLDTSLNNDRLTVLLSGLAERGYNSHNMEISASLNTPFLGYEEIKADIVHNRKSGNTFYSKIQVNKNKATGSVTHTLNIRDAMNFETVMQLTSNFYPDMKLSIVQASNGRQMEHTSYVQWHRSKKMEINAQYFNKINRKEILLNIKTPFTSLSDMEMKSTIDCQNYEHKGKVVAVWNRRSKMTLSAEVKNYQWQSVDALLYFESSFQGHELYSTTLKYDITDPKKTLEASIMWDITKRNQLMLTGNFLNSQHLNNLEINLATPYSNFEKISFSTKLEKTYPESTLLMKYEVNEKKITFRGKTMLQKDFSEISMEYSSPFEPVKELRGLAKYIRRSASMDATVQMQWNKINKYEAKAEYTMGQKTRAANLRLLTPIKGYEEITFAGSGRQSGNKMSCEFAMEWDNGNKVSINSDYADNDKKEFNLLIQTPYEKCKTISLKSEHMLTSGTYEHELKVFLNRKPYLEKSVKVKYGGSHLLEAHYKLKSTSIQFKELKLVVDSIPEQYQLKSTIKWADEEANIHLLLNTKVGQFYNAQMELNTPIEGYRHFQVDGKLRNDHEYMDARLIMSTPFDILRSLDAYIQLNTLDTGYLVNAKVDYPGKVITVQGKMSNSQFKPLLLNLEIDAPFTLFRKISSGIEADVNNWSDAKVMAFVKGLKFNHTFSASIQKDEKTMNFKTKIDSSALSFKPVIFEVKTNYEDSQRITLETTGEIFEKVHLLNGEYKNNGRVLECLVKVDSPVFPEKTSEIKLKLSRRRNGKILDGEGNFVYANTNHQIKAKYENKDNQLFGNIRIESDFLPSSTLTSEIKYTNNNGRDMEIAASMSTPESTHLITGSLKNFEGEKMVQLKVECPMSDLLNPLTITGTFSNERYSTMDTSFAVSTSGKELRIAGSMKNEGKKNGEAFLTLNTPFEVLKMVRLDGKFRNDDYRSFDGSLQLETSNPHLESLGITSKLIRSDGSEEMSLMLRLPLENYRNIQLLGNAHYNSDYSSADSRITFSLPTQKYVVYGQYGLSQARISGRGEIEYNNIKWVASGRIHQNAQKKDVSLSITNPNSQTHTVGGSYESSTNQQAVSAMYTSPSNERYSWNSSLSYENIGNFGLDYQAETPYYNYRNIQGSIQQQYNRNYVSTNVECFQDGKRGYFKLNHRIQRDGSKGSLQISCPCINLRDAKLNYNRAKTYTKVEDTIEFDYNRNKQVKVEILQFGQESAHLVVDAPVLSLTVSADSKKLGSGQELSLRSTYQKRSMSFRTSHQINDFNILNDAAFSWDERERTDKKISYDFKLSKTDSGRELWTKLDTPLRSIMLKGNFTQTSRSRSGGIDFYWDANRSTEKHMAVGAMYNDLSNGKQNTHKLQFTMEHPKLQKDIVQTNVISFGPSEISLKSELEYSRERHHNLIMEAKASDLSRGDIHYKGEFFLRHPASRMDIRAAADLLDTKLESTVHLQLKSLDRHQQQNVRELKAKIMKLRQEIELIMSSNQDQMTVSGRMSGGRGETDISLEKRTNDQKDLTTHIRYSRRNRALDVSVMDAKNSGLQLSAAFPKESASLKLSHSNQGNVFTDVHMLLGLEQSRILKSRLNWRPRIVYDLRIFTGETLRSVMKSSRDGYAAWSESISHELSTRTDMLSRAMTQHMSLFTEELKMGVADIVNDLKAGSDTFYRMYKRNEFHMRDAVDQINQMAEATREFVNGMSLAGEVLYNIAVEQLENMYDSLYYSLLDFNDYLSSKYSDFKWRIYTAGQSIGKSLTTATLRMGQSLQSLADRMIIRFDKWLRSYAPCIIDGYYYTKHVADKIRYSVNGITSTISGCFSSNRYYVALKNYLSNVMETYNTFRKYNYAESAQAFLDKVYDMQLMETIMNHPTVDYMSDIATSALKKSIEVYHNLGMDVVVSNVADNGYSYLKNKAIETAQEYIAEFYQSRAGAKYDFSPERGQISLELTLPVSRSNLIEVFDIQSYPEYQKMMSVSHLAANYYEDFCIWDFYYKLVKYFTPNYWLPAFRARALISGNQHYVTFDKLAYDFAGRCSYLLARDFVDGNFTAIINYGTEDHQRKSLTLLLDDKKIDIGSDYRITINDARAELPLQFGRTVIIREGVNIRVENERTGLSVVCNFVHNYCSVSVSGFYFGRTGGMLGTFNYEPSLDMMTPSRYVMSEVERFSSAWEVGQTVCRSNDNYATLPSNDYKVQNMCKSLFEKSTSEFRSCFKQVDPKIYLNMCITDLSAVHLNEHQHALCQSAAAYVSECKMEGVYLRMPKHCVRCEKQDGSYMQEGDALQFPRDGRVETADVVFLVEEKQCNRERVRYLSKLAQGIEDNFRQNGYKDVRYSVVGFGGDRIHSDPHIHTMDGMETGPLRSLDSALESLVFGDGPVNILEAMRFAASLSYRPGTTKSFILVKCSTCKSEEVKAEYSEMLRTLLDGDISLHLLMDQKYEMKGTSKNSKARKVIGVDKKFAYTLKDVKDSRLSGDGDLLAQLRIPKDVCIPLAFEVNGSSFDSQFLTETKRNTNKKFMDVLARLVVKSSSVGTTDWGMCCECLATEQGVGKATCQRCVSQELATMISGDATRNYNQGSERRSSPR